MRWELFVPGGLVGFLAAIKFDRGYYVLAAVAVEGFSDAFDHARGKGIGTAEFADPLLVFAAGEVARAGGAVFYFAAGREAKSLLRAFVSLLLGHGLILKLGESSILQPELKSGKGGFEAGKRYIWADCRGGPKNHHHSASMAKVSNGKMY
jgi:hypothetical protein